MDKLDARMDGFDNKLSRFKIEIDMKLDDQLVEIKNMISGFKSDIYNLVDGVLGEIQTNREERTIIGHQLTQQDKTISDHEMRLGVLEKTKND